MISSRSSLASSTPATSLKVIFRCCVECRRALLLPKLNALFPPLCICRIMKIQNPMMRMKGENWTSIDTQPLELGSAKVIATFLSESKSNNFG